MNIDFDVSQNVTAEFGVGQREGEVAQYYLMPVDDTVQDALLREAESTITSIAQMTTSTARMTAHTPHFDPSEKYGNKEYVVLPLQHELAASLAELHEVDNLPLTTPQLESLRNAHCYFLRGTDSNGRRLTALNRASQFKATLGRQGRLLMLFSDALQVIPDPVMQLNAGFDIVIDSEFIHILHPASFRALGNIDKAIAEAVPQNVRVLSQAAFFVDWSNIEEYAVRHSRAASLLASIRTQGYAEYLDKAALKSLCQRQGVSIDASQSQIVVPKEKIIPFLEVMDRRRYEIGLVPNRPEQYKATSRTRVGGSGT